jgi:hypothetical protein
MSIRVTSGAYAESVPAQLSYLEARTQLDLSTHAELVDHSLEEVESPVLE